VQAHTLVERIDGEACVADYGRLVGLVRLEGVRKVPCSEWDTKKAQEIMTPANELTIASQDEDASQALRKHIRRDVRQIPVIQDGRLVGMLRCCDVLRWLQLQSSQA
jgi:CBS domain-containing protein